MPKKKKPPTETPTQLEAPTKVETPQQLTFKVRKISNEEYLAYGNEKKESEYAKIAKSIVEKALESDSPILVKLPENISVRRIVPILGRIVSEMWKSGTKIEFKASYKNNEIAIRVKRE